MLGKYFSSVEGWRGLLLEVLVLTGETTGLMDNRSEGLKPTSGYFMWISNTVHATLKVARIYVKTVKNSPLQHHSTGYLIHPSPQRQAKLPGRPPDTSKSRTIRIVHHQLYRFCVREPTCTGRVVMREAKVVFLSYAPTESLEPHPGFAPTCSSGPSAPFPSARFATSEPAR